MEQGAHNALDTGSNPVGSTMSKLTELRVAIKAQENGILVSRPLFEGRYDLLFDFGSKILRVQVKECSCTKDGNCICVSLSSGSYPRGNKYGKHTKRFYTSDEIDVLIVYTPITGKYYVLEPEIWNKKSYVNLRFKQTVNGQGKKINYAKNYEWGNSNEIFAPMI